MPKLVISLTDTQVKSALSTFKKQSVKTLVKLADGKGLFFIIDKSGYAYWRLKKHGQWLDLYVSPNSSVDNRRKVMDDFYRVELKTALDELLLEWREKMQVKISAYGIRKMKTKWGSCNSVTVRTLFNLELAKKPYECLEYIVVHELVHLFVRTHNDEFLAYMNQYLPDWKQRKALLRD